MSLQVEQGGEYRGETYVFCDSHPTAGPNNGQGYGAIFEGTGRAELVQFIAHHADCGTA